MAEHEPTFSASTLSASDANHLPALPVAELDMPAERRKRCHHCGGPFGMMRRRRAGRQFCSAACTESHADGVRKAVEARARWYDYLYRRR